VAKLADADVKGLALEVTAEVPCDGISGFDSRTCAPSRSPVRSEPQAQLDRLADLLGL
jgi:hypothetical protein